MRGIKGCTSPILQRGISWECSSTLRELWKQESLAYHPWLYKTTTHPVKKGALGVKRQGTQGSSKEKKESPAEKHQETKLP